MPTPRVIDRRVELARLRKHWEETTRGRPALLVVRGLRQVGKTFLLAHLVDQIQEERDGARAVLFTALPNASQHQQLTHLARSLRQQLDTPFLPERYDHWDSALRWMANLATAAPLLVVLDELPYLLESTPSLTGHLQQLWDDLRRMTDPPRIMVALTGSSISVMRSMTEAGGALFGRLSDELVLRPFDLPATALVLDRMEPDAVIEAYAACGGYPHHLLSWDQDSSSEANLATMVYQAGGLLLRNGSQLVADLPEEGGYRRTLHAIGSGAHERSRVATSAGQRVERPLALLEATGLIRLDRPVGSRDRSPGRWEVADPFLRGWYEMCWPDQEQIEAGLGSRIADRRAGRWQRHLGWVFEEQARLHAIRLAQAGELPADALYGRWWSTRGPQTEIDVLGIVGSRRTVLVGEARWDSRPLPSRTLDELKAKERAAPDPVAQPMLCTWSRGGGTGELRSAGVRSFTPADMIMDLRPDASS